MWSEYSKLKSSLLRHHRVDIEEITEIKPFLQNLQKNRNEEPTKSKSFTKENIEKFLNEAPDDVWLDVKVVMIMGFHGYCRRAELHGLLTSDLKIYYDKDDVDKEDPILEVTLPASRVKNNAQRKFVIRGMFFKIYEKYAKLRDKVAPDNRFFYQYYNGQCRKQVIGINQFGGMPKRIATYLGLENPESFTGHAFRHTAASSFMEGGGDEENLMIAGGWKSNTAAKGYVKVAHRTLEKLNKCSTADINLNADSSVQQLVIPSPQPEPTKITKQSVGFTPGTTSKTPPSSTITSPRTPSPTSALTSLAGPSNLGNQQAISEAVLSINKAQDGTMTFKFSGNSNIHLHLHDSMKN